MNTLSLELGLGVLGLLLLVAESFSFIPRKSIAYVALAGVGAALVLLVTCASGGAVPAGLQEFYVVDRLALFYKGLALVSTLVVIILSLEYASVINQFVSAKPGQTKEAGLGEFFCLPLFVCVGMMVMASAVDIITIFVALELVTISFYVLVAFMRRNALSLEAGVKYLILGALSTGLLVYGMAWLYGLTGETTLAGISGKLQHWEGGAVAPLFASALVLAGLGFKVAAVPFQIWVPDVYQGAPTPVTAFLSVGSKASGVIVLTRLFESLVAGGSVVAQPLIQFVLILAGVTIAVGNFAALKQTNFKRLLGYSSIAHAGFLLLALGSRHAVSGFSPAQIAAFYLATYVPMTFVCFLVLSAGRAQGLSDEIVSYTGLAKKCPVLAGALMLALASLAGLPLTAGFMGKLLVIFSAAYDGSYLVLALAVIGAITGFYYYFKVILVLYAKPEGATPTVKLSRLSRATLIVLAGAIVVIGVYPKSVQCVLKGAKKAEKVALGN
jgi:NADH-quinone oxidoreductase subunit N